VGQSGGRGVFLIGLTVFSAVVTLAAYQVPQPWRGFLIGWLLFVATVGVIAARLIGHYLQWKSIQLQSRQGTAARTAVRSPRTGRTGSRLKVVVSDTLGNGRHTIR
jgi:hypothetical protein